MFISNEFAVTSKYSNNRDWSTLDINKDKFVSEKTAALGISSKTLNDKLLIIKDAAAFDTLVGEYKDEKILAGLNALKSISLTNGNGQPIR